MSGNVLITGGARRLGRAMALHLAQSGWNVAIHYHRSHREAEALAGEIRTLGRQACIIGHHLEEAATSLAIVSHAAEALGGLDALILNASHFEKDNLETFSAQTWQSHMTVHVESSLYLIRAFSRSAASANRTVSRSVIALLDGSDGWSISPHYLTYSLSKRALENAITLLAAELAPGIRINGIAPGPTLPNEGEDAALFERLRERTALQCLPTPADIVRTLDYLLATPCITGQIIRINGGMGLSRPPSPKWATA